MEIRLVKDLSKIVSLCMQMEGICMVTISHNVC
jgi:hypothetical protein